MEKTNPELRQNKINIFIFVPSAAWKTYCHYILFMISEEEIVFFFAFFLSSNLKTA